MPGCGVYSLLRCPLQEGDSLPELETIEANLQHMKNVGFEIVECTDLVELSELPWYVRKCDFYNNMHDTKICNGLGVRTHQ